MLSENIEIKNCVGEIIDALYDKAGFDDWWCNLNTTTEQEIINQLEEIIKRRFEWRT